MSKRPFTAQNKDQAMKQLKAKLYELELQKKNADKQAMGDNKLTLVGEAKSELLRIRRFTH